MFDIVFLKHQSLYKGQPGRKQKHPEPRTCTPAKCARLCEIPKLKPPPKPPLKVKIYEGEY